MEQEDLVSIVLPTYNGSKFIRQSIESCLNQTFENIELIIVNDASTDNTKEIIYSYADHRIIYIENYKNQGLANSLNIGFAKSKGNFLTWTSDDNYYAIDAVKQMMGFIRHHQQVDFVYANYYLINDSGSVISKIPAEPVWKLLFSNSIGACFLYSRKVMEKIGGYNSEYFLNEDFEYWSRISKYFVIKKIDKYLYYYRIHPDRLSSKATVQQEINAVKIIKTNLFQFLSIDIPIGLSQAARYHIKRYPLNSNQLLVALNELMIRIEERYSRHIELSDIERNDLNKSIQVERVNLLRTNASYYPKTSLCILFDILKINPTIVSTKAFWIILIKLMRFRENPTIRN